jgi:hypothetical protein
MDDTGDPTQRRPGMRKHRWSRSSPPATARAKSAPDATVTNGVQQGAMGDTDRYSPIRPPTVHRSSGAVPAAWRVKDSNLGRHQPTDLQFVAVRVSAGHSVVYERGLARWPPVSPCSSRHHGRLRFCDGMWTLSDHDFWSVSTGGLVSMTCVSGASSGMVSYVSASRFWSQASWN